MFYVYFLRSSVAGRAFLRDKERQVDYVLVYEQSSNGRDDAQRIFYEQNLIKNGLVLEKEEQPMTNDCHVDTIHNRRLV